MKIYSFGAETAPVILLLPGICCHWKSNFGKVIPLLSDTVRVLCVSYDGFDETERTEFSGMIKETEKIEAYIRENCGGRICAAYGYSLGGSFVGLLAARQRVHIAYAKLCTLSNTVLLHPEKLNPTVMQEFLLAEAPHTDQASQIHTVVILLSHPAISPPDHQSKGFSLFEERPRSFQTNKL